MRIHCDKWNCDFPAGVCEARREKARNPRSFSGEAQDYADCLACPGGKPKEEETMRIRKNCTVCGQEIIGTTHVCPITTPVLVCPDCGEQTPTGKRCSKCRASAGGRANAAKRFAEKCGMNPTTTQSPVYDPAQEEIRRLRTEIDAAKDRLTVMGRVGDFTGPPFEGPPEKWQLADVINVTCRRLSETTTVAYDPGQIEEIRRLKEENKGLRDELLPRDGKFPLNPFRQTEEILQLKNEIQWLRTELSVALAALAKERAVPLPDKRIANIRLLAMMIVETVTPTIESPPYHSRVRSLAMMIMETTE